MQIQCDCGNFRAELTGLSKNTPGRLACYCDDCQSFAKKINREDILDSFGGTEIIPVYPCEFKFIQGQEHLKCNLLTNKGLTRWTAECCNSPIANIRPKFPWVGVYHTAYTAHDAKFLSSLGMIRSRIMGKYKKGHPPFEISDKLRLKDVLVVAPFLLKGFLLKKYKQSPFFKQDGHTPIMVPVKLNE
ncbi:MAG: hypothetical protein KDD45_06480 [Bdellovibrionales bacterium]|nr:hypothetical protein [Bdellovibrionales bacterium]